MNERMLAESNRIAERVRQETTPQDFEVLPIELQGAHSRSIQAIQTQITREHGAMLYHRPAHTYGETTRNSDGSEVERLGTLRVASKLVEIAHQKLPVRITESQAFAAWSSGLLGGFSAHDSEFRIDSTLLNNKNGVPSQVKRFGGWKNEAANSAGEAGNEWRSFLRFRNEFLRQYNDQLSDDEDCEAEHERLLVEDPLYKQYISAAEAVCKGTRAHPTFSGVPRESLSAYESVIDERAWNSLAVTAEDGSVTYPGLKLDSKYATESLASLIGSTTDLSASGLRPDLFRQTGDAEFWELNYATARDCSEDTTQLSNERCEEILGEMLGWRKVQIGVALHQLARMEKNFEPAVIAHAMETDFNIEVGEDEVERFANKVKSRFTQFVTSINEATEAYISFNSTFLTDKDRSVYERLAGAISVMNGEPAQLRAYVAHVGTSLAQ